MAEKINMTPKQSGDQLTAAEFNTIVGKIDAAIEEVNGHTSSLAEAQQALGGLADDLDSESQARQQADSGKVDKQEGLGLSENSFTTPEKTKLAVIDHQVSHLVTWAGGGEKPVIDADKLIGELVEGKTHLVTTITFTDNSTVAIVKVDKAERFNNCLSPGEDTYSYNFIAVQPDWKILIGGSIEGFLRRLNPDGSEDTGFTSRLPAFDAEVFGGHLLPNNKIFVCGGFPGGVKKLHPDGSEDTSFVSAQTDKVLKLIVNPDESLILRVELPNMSVVLKKLNADGTEDAAFAANLPAISGPVDMLPLGQNILVYGWTSASVSLKKIDTDGVEDAGFSANVPNNGMYGAVYVNSGSVFVRGANGVELRKLNADGAEDAAFAANLPNLSGALYVGFFSDGKIAVAGYTFLKKLNADGTEDAGFSANLPGFAADITIKNLEIINDAVLISGYYHNTWEYFFYRFGSNGVKDSVFASTLQLNELVDKTIPFGGDKILIFGWFTGQLKRLDNNGFEYIDYKEDLLSLIKEAVLTVLPGDLFVISPAGTIARLAAPAGPATLKHSGVAGSLPFWEVS